MEEGIFERRRRSDLQQGGGEMEACVQAWRAGQQDTGSAVQAWRVQEGIGGGGRYGGEEGVMRKR